MATEKPGGLNYTDIEAMTVMAVCGGVVVLILIFDVWYYCSTMTLKARYNTPNKDLIKMLNDTQDVIDYKSIQNHVRDILSSTPIDSKNETTNSALISLIRSQNPAENAVEFVNGARDNRTLPIRKDNRFKFKDRPIVNLHVSELTDLYGNPIFLSAAPLPGQFQDQWQAIWQANIGVIVWIGRLVTHESRMDAYINLEQGKNSVYGNFRIETIESGDLVYKFALYFLRVYRGKQMREMVLIHAYEWLQESVTWALERDVELMLCLKDEHIRRMKVSGLRGILFQCKFGTAGSASMASAYIGFQFWLYGRRVNFIGVLKYIRRMRPMAFEQTGETAQTFAVQIKVAYTVMYALAKFCETGKISRYEKWIKTLLSQGSTRSSF